MKRSTLGWVVVTVAIVLCVFAVLYFSGNYVSIATYGESEEAAEDRLAAEVSVDDLRYFGAEILHDAVIDARLQDGSLQLGVDSMVIWDRSLELLSVVGEPEEITSAKESLVKVEDLLRELDTYVDAVVTSDPERCAVNYYRALHGAGRADPTVMTNDTIRIHAGLYGFACRGEERLVDCAVPCQVRF